jgi:hypothetical protein
MTYDKAAVWCAVACSACISMAVSGSGALPMLGPAAFWALWSIHFSLRAKR